MKRSFVALAAAGVLCIAAATSIHGCAARTSALAASTYGKSSGYRSATAYVEMAPDRVFNSAVGMLLERGDFEITDLKEADKRCTAASGDYRLTLRVLESGHNRSRLSVLIVGGDDPMANQKLADELTRKTCARLPMPCEIKAVDP